MHPMDLLKSSRRRIRIRRRGEQAQELSVRIIKNAAPPAAGLHSSASTALAAKLIELAYGF